MYLKLIGCLGIVAATSGYGYSKGLEYQRGLTDTGELQRVIRQLAGEMEYTYAPLSQVCASVSRRCSQIYRSWLEHLAKELEQAATWKPQTEELWKMGRQREESEENIPWQMGERESGRQREELDGLEESMLWRAKSRRPGGQQEASEGNIPWQMGSKCSERSLAKIWEESCKKDLASLLLGKEERLRLQELGLQLGSLDKKQEAQIFWQYADFLEEKRDILRKDIQEKRRLCSLLGVTAGLFLTILIL